MNIDFKNIINDKKNRIIIGLSVLSIVLLCIVLYPVFFGCKNGYVDEWYGSNKIVERGILKAHKNRVSDLKKKIQQVLSSDKVNVDDLRAVFKELADERAQFNTIIENNMIDKVVKMSQKKRDSFAGKMFMDGKSKAKHSKSENHGKMKNRMMKDKQNKKDTVAKKVKKISKKISAKASKSMN